MNRARDDVLSGPGLALHERGRVGGRDALEHRVEPPHLDAGADELPERLVLRDLQKRRLVISLDAHSGSANA
jgi:hypothetical protein